MKSILILGGTNFIGHNLVERLLVTNTYELTLFNRQKTDPGLFRSSSIFRLLGDRETVDIKQISDKEWDFVIDLSCYYPAALNDAITALKSTSKYIFISTCSVYDNQNDLSRLRNESAAILDCSDEQKVDREPKSYGNRKAECERILKSSGIPYIILRPALVYGRYDPTDRFYYWLYQVKQQLPMLLPENGERLFSTTYVDDLVEAIILSMEKDIEDEVYNVITTPESSIRKIVDLSAKELDIDYSAVNAPVHFLSEQNVHQWVDMPLWINGDHFTYSNEKLKDELDLELTPLAEGIRESIEYFEKINWPEPQYGISESRKMELLQVLK